jgi:pimeloyl-ACP methyl ester carboxylesterase
MVEVVTRTVRANGLTFAVDETGVGDTVALLLHGFPESRQTWRGQMSALAALGWRVCAPDLRGYGGTSRPVGLEPYRIEHLVDDVAGLFEALGARRRILIGHDWGGVIAWQAALRGVPLDGLVILNAPHPLVFDRVLNDGWAQKRKSWYVAFFQLPGLPELSLAAGGGRGLVRAMTSGPSRIDPDLLEVFRRNVVQPGAATAMINYYRANATRLLNDEAVRRPLDVPTLVVWGEDDLALDVSLTRGMEPLVTDLTLETLPGVSHWVQLDAPAAVNAAIGRWARGKHLSA